MVYECECCGYVTIRKANFLRHKNRKNTCDKTKTRVCTKGVTRSVDIEQNRYAVEQNRYVSTCKSCEMFTTTTTTIYKK